MDRVYIIVAYCYKDEAKNLGAKWDNDRKMWYTTSKNKYNGELFYRFVKYDDAMEVKTNPNCVKCGKLYSLMCTIDCV